MKVMTIILVFAAVCTAPSYAAKPRPIDHNPTAQIPVEQMTCAEAQTFAFNHGYYWKLVNSKDLVPIYPIYMSPYDVSCSGKSSLFDVRERTADEVECHLTWQCMKM